MSADRVGGPSQNISTLQPAPEAERRAGPAILPPLDPSAVQVDLRTDGAGRVHLHVDVGQGPKVFTFANRGQFGRYLRGVVDVRDIHVTNKKGNEAILEQLRDLPAVRTSNLGAILAPDAPRSPSETAAQRALQTETRAPAPAPVSALAVTKAEKVVSEITGKVAAGRALFTPENAATLAGDMATHLATLEAQPATRPRAQQLREALVEELVALVEVNDEKVAAQVLNNLGDARLSGELFGRVLARLGGDDWDSDDIMRVLDRSVVGDPAFAEGLASIDEAIRHLDTAALDGWVSKGDQYAYLHIAAALYRNRPGAMVTVPNRDGKTEKMEIRTAIETQIVGQLEEGVWEKNLLQRLTHIGKDSPDKNLVQGLIQVFGDDALEMMGRNPALRAAFKKTVGPEHEVADLIDLIEFAKKTWKTGRYDSPDAVMKAFQKSDTGRDTGRKLLGDTQLQEKVLTAAAPATEREAYLQKLGLAPPPPPQPHEVIEKALPALETRHRGAAAEEIVAELAAARSTPDTYDRLVDQTATALHQAPVSAVTQVTRQALKVGAPDVAEHLLLREQESVGRLIDRKGVAYSLADAMDDDLAKLPPPVLAALHESPELKGASPNLKVRVHSTHALAQARQDIGAFARTASTEEVAWLLACRPEDKGRAVDALRGLRLDAAEDVAAVRGHLVAMASQRQHVANVAVALRALGQSAYRGEAPSAEDAALLDALVRGQPTLQRLLDTKTRTALFSAFTVSDLPPDQLGPWLADQEPALIIAQIRRLEDPAAVARVTGGLGELVGKGDVGATAAKMLQACTGAPFPDATQQAVRAAALDAVSKNAEARAELQLLLGMAPADGIDAETVGRLLDKGYPPALLQEGLGRHQDAAREKLESTLVQMQESRQPKHRDQIVSLLAGMGYEGIDRLHHLVKLEDALEAIAGGPSSQAALALALAEQSPDRPAAMRKVVQALGTSRRIVAPLITTALGRDPSGQLLAELLVHPDLRVVQQPGVASTVWAACQKQNKELSDLPTPLLEAMLGTRDALNHVKMRHDIERALAAREAAADPSAFVQRAHDGRGGRSFSHLLENAEPAEVVAILRKTGADELDELAALLERAESRQTTPILSRLAESSYGEGPQAADRDLLETLFQHRPELEARLTPELRAARLRTLSLTGAASVPGTLARWLASRPTEEIVAAMSGLDGSAAGPVAKELGRLAEDEEVGLKAVEVLQAATGSSVSAGIRNPIRLAALEGASGDKRAQAKLRVLLGVAEPGDLEPRSLKRLLDEVPASMVQEGTSRLEGAARETANEAVAAEKLDAAMLKVMTGFTDPHAGEVLEQVAAAKDRDPTVAGRVAWALSQGSSIQLGELAERALTKDPSGELLAAIVLAQGRPPLSLPMPVIEKPGMARAIIRLVEGSGRDLTRLPEALLQGMGRSRDPDVRARIAYVFEQKKIAAALIPPDRANEAIAELLKGVAKIQKRRTRLEGRYEGKLHGKMAEVGAHLVRAELGPDLAERSGAAGLAIASGQSEVILRELQRAADRNTGDERIDDLFNAGLKTTADAMAAAFRDRVVGPPEAYDALLLEMRRVKDAAANATSWSALWARAKATVGSDLEDLAEIFVHENEQITPGFVKGIEARVMREMILEALLEANARAADDVRWDEKQARELFTGLAKEMTEEAL